MHRGIQDYGLLISGITVASLLFGSAAVAADRAVLHVEGTASVDGIMFPDGTSQTSATAQGPQGPQGEPGGSQIVEVTSAGQIWMDRNLGALRVATKSADPDAYGSLYQWGRSGDGHEYRTSPTTSTLSSSDTPDHGSFITTGSSSSDWRTTKNDNLWQGAFGINNPCPSGFRLPTDTELEAERSSWSSYDAAGALGSPLKLVVAGFRNLNQGTISGAGSYGSYWSSTVDGTYSRYLYFDSGDANMYSHNRANGFSVRCLKD